MKVTAEKLTNERQLRRACEMTLRPGQTSNVSLFNMYRCEHSPIRTQRFWVEFSDIETFVSVHLVRHKHGVEHFVQSNRSDRGGAGDAVVTRETPVNHGAEVNAQALIAMSRKRLCLHSHPRTVAAWTRLRDAVGEVDPDLKQFMVPECCYRGFCPELRLCKAGPRRVVSAYAEDNPAYVFRMKQLDGMP